MSSANAMMLRNLFVLLVLSSLHVTVLSQLAVEIIDRVNIDLRDAEGGSLKATFELRNDHSPEHQADQFCSMYFLQDEQCSVLKSRAVDNYNLYQEQLQLTTTTPDMPHGGRDVIGSIPLVLLSPEGGELEIEFLLKDYPDASLQAQDFCSIYGLSGEECAALDEAAVALMNEYRLQDLADTRSADPDMAEDISTGTSGSDNVAEQVPVAIHSIPLIITDSTGESRELQFPLYDTVDSETQVRAFCAVNDLLSSDCTSLSQRASELLASYEHFVSLLKRGPVTTQSDMEGRGGGGGGGVILKLPIQIEAVGEFVSEEFTLVEGEDPAQQAQLFCKNHNVPDEFCSEMIRVALEQYNDFKLATTVPMEDSEGVRNEEKAAEDVSIVSSIDTTPTTSPQTTEGISPLVLDILRWGLSSDFLSGTATAGTVARDDTLSYSAAGSTRAFGTPHPVADSSVIDDVQAQTDEAVDHNHIAAWARFGLSDEYFAMLRSKVA